jgi:hypothetical protein
LPRFKKERKLFTIEELCKLRQVETKRKKKAFLRFLGNFLESVCGAQAWGSQKEHTLISKGKLMSTVEKLVTRSDETFTLLMYENYIGK